MASSKTRSTLTLKPTTDDKPADGSRRRSGARARRALVQDRERQKSKRQKQHARNAQTPRQTRPDGYSTTPRRPRRLSTDPGTPAVRDTETLQAVFAPCPRGLETILEHELSGLGLQEVRRGRAGCHFKANWTDIMRVNLHSRIATRVLMQTARARVSHEDDILELAQQTPWEQWFGPEHTLRVDTSAVDSPMTSLQYCNLRAKDGVCDRLREREGRRPDIDTVRPDARVHLFLDKTTATLYLDTTGESLFKRGWRWDKGEAPLRENLAAGLLALSGWQPGTPLLDPFCGSGTLLIEAAWIALGMAPGRQRPFAFQRLRDHDESAWEALRQQALDAVQDQPLSMVGIDTDTQAITAAKRNLQRAGLKPEHIHFEQADARTFHPPFEQPGTIVTNPPYGERLDSGPDLWTEWASQLKRHYAGWELYVISNDLDLPRAMRLRPHRRYPVYNGALDCRLFGFEMVAGSPT